MRSLLVHPTGNQNSRQAALALYERGVLDYFVTGLAFNSMPAMFLPGLIRSEISRRSFPEIEDKVRAVARFRECIRLLASRLGIRALVRPESGWASIDEIYRLVDLRASRLVSGSAAPLASVYGYEDGAEETFRAARRQGIRCVYELPIGYWREHRKLNQEETIRQPKWAGTWHAVQDSKAKLVRKDLELEMADTVVVPSRFVAQTLSAYPQPLRDIRIIPYGFPKPIVADEREWYHPSRTLRVLYVGGLSQRKGLSYLCDALESFGQSISTTFIGIGPGEQLLRQNLPFATFLGSLPHAAVLQQMRQHDVLIFPSLFEGFGMVITEAMSQGMVVISTERTGLPDIADETNAICIPSGNSAAISSVLSELLSQPNRVSEIGKAALARASKYTWADYRARLYQEAFLC